MGPEERAAHIERDDFDVDAQTRFWSKVDRDRDGCWLWTAGTVSFGYGAFKDRGRQHGAHRVAYALANGAAPAKMQIRHTCDNPRCCRPDHLLIGTCVDNNQDRVLRGRSGKCANDWSRGENNGSAKLDWITVRTIRSEYAAGNALRKLANKYKISKSTVSLIVNNQTWRET